MKNPLNILILQAEDIGRHLGCYGDPVAHTPHLDAFAAKSTRYTNAFTHAPVCAPSRGGMATGQYPYSLGNHHMRSTLAHSPRHFVQELKDAGYYVNWHTKLDFNFDPEEDWRDADNAWYEEKAPEQPFFLYENFGLTHESRMFPIIPNGHNTNPPEAQNGHRHREEDMVPPPWLTDGPELRKQLVAYYDAMSCIDAQFGHRLAWLEEQGLSDNTLVIFLSDHGRGLPREKRWCYDAGLHLPLMIRWPEHLKPGSIQEELVAWVDIAPTVLSLAGVDIPDRYQGQIFLGPDRAPEREYCFAGRDRMDEVFDRVRAVRDHKWHYIRNFAPKLPWAQCQKYMEQQDVMGVMRKKWRQGTLSEPEMTFFRDHKPVEELYDAEQDPDCMQNLAEDPAHAEVLSRMRCQLDAHLVEVGDLAAITEEELIEQGVLTNRLPDYHHRRGQLLPEEIMGPAPFPTTLREAKAADLVV